MTCYFCNSKAILNLKHVNGIADTSGPAVQLGAEEKYYPTCFTCYRNSVNDANQSPIPLWMQNKTISYNEPSSDDVLSTKMIFNLNLNNKNGTGEKKDLSP